MASPTYHKRVVVLRKTNLGEADLILTMLSEDGSQIRAVAKGARKPKSSFSSRMDLFCVCDILAVQRPNLHIVSEVRLVNAHMNLREDIVRFAAAAPILEALAKTSQEDLEVPRLFEMARAALDTEESCEESHVPAITAAFLVKLFAMMGFKPSLDTCVVCGTPCLQQATVLPNGEAVCDFSFIEGGLICPSCRGMAEHVRIPQEALLVAQAFLRSTFAQIIDSNPSLSHSFSVLRFCHEWMRSQFNINAKSLNYLLTCGFF